MESCNDGISRVGHGQCDGNLTVSQRTIRAATVINSPIRLSICVKIFTGAPDDTVPVIAALINHRRPLCIIYSTLRSTSFPCHATGGEILQIHFADLSTGCLPRRRSPMSSILVCPSIRHIVLHTYTKNFENGSTFKNASAQSCLHNTIFLPGLVSYHCVPP